MQINERITLLLQQMNSNVYEKETEIGLSLLAALAGESILLLGPPGVAKSMVARRLKYAFVNAKAFEYLMSRFSTPDEIFGPVSINKLKDADIYERITDGYLPTADVVFLDEIWKSGPAIQNSLLTVINEKIYRNGKNEEHLPLKLLVAASNELPTKGEGLEALWDRFLIRIVSTCIEQENTFYQMLLDESTPYNQEINPDLQISEAEYQEWQRNILQLDCDKQVLASISFIRKGLNAISLPDTNLKRQVYVSDRRWKKILHLMKASAFAHDQNSVTLNDLFIIHHCLWNEADEREEIRKLVLQSLFFDIEKELTRISEGISASMKASHAHLGMRYAQPVQRELNLQAADQNFEALLENVFATLTTRTLQLKQNMFLSVSEKKEIEAYAATLRKQVAFIRVDIRKLMYGDEA